jgi:hypothetical protein
VSTHEGVNNYKFILQYCFPELLSFGSSAFFSFLPLIWPFGVVDLRGKSSAFELVRESISVEGACMLDDSVLNQQFQHFAVGYLVPE